MRKLNNREKERVQHLNELVTDAVALYNECLQQVVAYRQEAAELQFYIELHAAFPLTEWDYRDYSSLYSELKRIDLKMYMVNSEVSRLETRFAQFNLQYNRLINQIDRAGEKDLSKIFAQMEELALDLNIHSYNAKVDLDLRCSLFYDFRQKLRAILFN
jgi:hypothetical protein